MPPGSTRAGRELTEAEIAKAERFVRQALAITRSSASNADVLMAAFKIASLICRARRTSAGRLALQESSE